MPCAHCTRCGERFASKLHIGGLKAEAFHGDLSQGRRTQLLDDFKASRLQVLVATDLAARGIDIEQLPVVVNYDLPMVAEDYVHRIGRTGRAGRPGRALSFVSTADRRLLRDIQRLLPTPSPLRARARVLRR